MAPSKRRAASPASPLGVDPPRSDASATKDRDDTNGSPSQRIFPIVGVGASAGGLPALEKLFSSLPVDSDLGMAFVIVQHLSPDHKSMLSELVGRHTRLQVSEIVDGAQVEPDRIYIIPPNSDLLLEGERLRLHEPVEPRGRRLPIDSFFRSLADSLRERAIGIVLSGTGSDGTAGARAIKASGGMIIAQDPETAAHGGMPRSVIATGLVDFVLAPALIPAQLVAFTRHVSQALEDSDGLRDATALKNIASLIRSTTGHDFSQYKTNTLVRRIQRRMALRQLDTFADYHRFARDNRGEADALFRDLLIGVTSFFRDPDAFQLIEEKVIPALLSQRPVHEPLRIWTCGCSTGEEAYSLAILVQEQVEAAKRPFKVQIFATDLDRNAIEAARTGVFPDSIAADVSVDRLARYFIHEPERNRYRVHKVIRDLLVFSEQDVIKDPPFSKIDLISCRNLLIYLNADLQRKLIPLFHYALRAGGFLFLGTSETVGESGRLFDAVDRKWKIYRRETIDSGIARSGFPEFNPPAKEQPPPMKRATSGDHPAEPQSLRHLTEQSILAHYSEAGILINGRGDILYIMGRTGRYLEPASGDPLLNVLAMARDGLRRELTTALHKVVAQRQPVQYRGLKVVSEGTVTVADLTVRPVTAPQGAGSSDLYLVVLQEGLIPEVAGASPEQLTQEGQVQVAQLEQELRAKEDYLQATLEEMETTNEELKSTNEEMQSVNEELQSTNEELETSKEELQSVNEELSTVNAELQDKVADLSRINNDMNNLLAGTGVGTVFVDHQLRIARFTPAATQVINLIPTDIGRPVAHVAANLVNYDGLSDDLAEVLRSLAPIEREVRTKDGAWYLMRIRPYRTMSNMIEGAVLTFVEISARKRAEDDLAASTQRFLAILNGIRAGVSLFDRSGALQFVNDHLCSLSGYSRSELLAISFQKLLDSDDEKDLADGLEQLEAGSSLFHFRHPLRKRSGGAEPVLTLLSAFRARDSVLETIVSLSIAEDDAEFGPRGQRGSP